MSESGTEIKVALIEDQRDVREGLTILINGSSGFRCVAAFRSMEEALRIMKRDAGKILDPALFDLFHKLILERQQSAA